MAHEAEQSVTSNLDLSEQLVEFLSALRIDGYRIGPREILLAQSLLVLLAAQGEFPADPARLKTYLAPIVCHSPDEQADFYSRFEQWARAFAGVLPAASDVPAVNTVLDRIRRGRRVVRWLFFVPALVIPLVVAVVLVPDFKALFWSRISTSNAGAGSASAGPRSLEGDRSGPLLSLSESGRSTFVAIVATSLVAGFMVYLIGRLIWWQVRARRFLERRGYDKLPRLTELRAKSRGFAVYDELEQSRAAREMKGRQRVERHRLDIVQSVDATVRNGGSFTPVRWQHWILSEYLVLVDRLSDRDHQARLADELVDRLAAADVALDRYDFRGDPRICLPQSRDGSPLSIADLEARSPEHRLLVFSDGAGLFHSLSGAIVPWVQKTQCWPQRALLTPVPESEWGYHEWALEQNAFFVLPSTPQGLDLLIDRMQFDGPVETTYRAVGSAFPPLISEDGYRWIQRLAPPAEAVEACLNQVRRYLGEEGYYWLCACAIYPALDWDLTVRLGLEIHLGPAPLFDESRLAALSRLPWFRHGTMPDWLRTRLVEELTPEREQAIRECLEKLLFETMEQHRHGFRIEIARANRPIFAALAPRVIRRLSRSEPKDSHYNDHVFARVLLHQRPAGPVVRIPRLFRLSFAAEEKQVDHAAVLEFAGRCAGASRGLVYLLVVLLSVLAAQSRLVGVPLGENGVLAWSGLCSLGALGALFGYATRQGMVVAAGLFNCAALVLCLLAPASYRNSILAANCLGAIAIAAMCWRRRPHLVGMLQSRAGSAAFAGAILAITLQQIHAAAYFFHPWSHSFLVNSGAAAASVVERFDIVFGTYLCLIPVTVAVTILGSCARQVWAFWVGLGILAASLLIFAMIWCFEMNGALAGSLASRSAVLLLATISSTLAIATVRRDPKATAVDPVAPSWRAGGALAALAAVLALAILAMWAITVGPMVSEAARSAFVIGPPELVLIIMGFCLGLGGGFAGYCAGHRLARFTGTVAAVAFGSLLMAGVLDMRGPTSELWVMLAFTTISVTLGPLAIVVLGCRQGEPARSIELRAWRVGRWLIAAAWCMVAIGFALDLTAHETSRQVVFPLLAGAGLSMSLIGKVAGSRRLIGLGIAHSLAALTFFLPGSLAFPGLPRLLRPR
jgi:hypothetical protein